MAKVTWPTGKPAPTADGLNKRFVDGDPAARFTNTGGDKGAKIIGNAKDASAGKLKTYKTSVMALNTGSIDGPNRGLGDKYGLGDRNDA